MTPKAHACPIWALRMLPDAHYGRTFLHQCCSCLGSAGAVALGRALKHPSARCQLRSLNLNHSGSYPPIGPAGAKELGAYLTSPQCSLTSLDLSCNCICGVNYLGSGVYDAWGVVAIANSFSPDRSQARYSLSHLNLASNALCRPVNGNCALTGIGALTRRLEYLSVSGKVSRSSLKSLDVSDNTLDVHESAKIIDVARILRIDLKIERHRGLKSNLSSEDEVRPSAFNRFH